jgi:small subunit ribosomal protein S8
MSMNDLVSDFVARINNARLAKLETIPVLRNNIVVEICKKLTTMGYLNGFEESKDKKTVSIELNLSRINEIKRISKPGRRVYKGADEKVRIVGGIGYTLFTTSKGILHQVDIAKQKVGGEALFSIF